MDAIATKESFGVSERLRAQERLICSQEREEGMLGKSGEDNRALTNIYIHVRTPSAHTELRRIQENRKQEEKSFLRTCETFSPQPLKPYYLYPTRHHKVSSVAEKK